MDTVVPSGVAYYATGKLPTGQPISGVVAAGSWETHYENGESFP